jgi:hypothetical protein
MRIAKALKQFTVISACVGLLGGQVAQAAAPIQDVQLHPGGRLVGQIVDGEAVPQAGIRVAVVTDSEVIAYADTDAEGRFEMRGMKAGVYAIQTEHNGAPYRFWSPNTAPPSAAPQAMLVNDGTVVRGQGWSNHFAWLANPWVLAAIVAGAIAIPLAVDGDAS